MKIIITSLIIGVLFGSSGAGRYKCPDGYVYNRYGRCEPSRESCQPGHYYALGECKACPCNNHEKSCEIDGCSRVHCDCRAGYTGKYCQNYGSSQIKLEKPLQVIVKPENQIVYRDFDEIHVNCIVNHPDAQVMWLRNGQIYTDQRGQRVGSTLRIDKARDSDSGSYICVAIKGGKAFKTIASIKVIEATAPVATITPITDGKMKVPFGEHVELTCNADGFRSHVSWQRISAKTGAQEIIQSSVTSEVHYQIMSMSEKTAGEYVCHAENPIGSDTKSIQVEFEPLDLKVYPEESQVVISGQSVTLECHKPAAYQNVEVHWARQDGSSLESNAYQSPNGSLTIRNITIKDGGHYNCSATKGVLSASATTEIKVQTLPVVEIPQSSHGEITVGYGEEKNLTCNASGHPPPNVQWRKFSEKTDSYEAIQQAMPNSAVLEYKFSSKKGQSLYQCLANNSAGSSTETVRIKHIDPVLEVLQGKHLVVTEGSSITLECRETAGYSNFKIFWRRKHKNIEPLNSSLTITNITSNQAGIYNCIGSNGATAASVWVEIEVNTLPMLEITQSTDGNITAKLRDKMKLTCDADGHPQPDVQWHKFLNKTNSYKAIGKASLKSAVHDIPFLTELDVGLYLCLANNSAGSSNKTVRVYNPLELEVYPGESQVVISGSSVTLECRESGRYSNIKFHWTREDDRSFASNVVQFANGSLTITSITINERGRYKCSASNGEVSGSVTGEIKVQLPPATEIPSTTTPNIMTPPKTSSDEFMSLSESGGEFQLKQTIEVSPKEQKITVGEGSKIVCELESLVKQTTIQLTWQRGGELSISENFVVKDGVLEIHEPTKADSGEYICVALNNEGIELSRASSTLKVTAPPLIWQDWVDEFVIGDNVTLNCRDGRNTSPTYSWTLIDRSLLPNEEARGNILTIYGFKEENKGTFCCNGQNADGSDQHCRSVEPEAIEIITLSSSFMQLTVDGSVAVDCSVVDKSGPKIDLHWERSDDPSSSNVITEEEGYLTLFKVTKMDSGDYVCRGLNADGEELERKTFTLQVISPPETIEITTDVSDNNDVTMTCEGTGDDLEYEWSNEERNLLSNENRWINTLTINEVKKENDRTFCCEVFNIAGTLEECKRLPTLLTISKSHSDVLADSPFEVDCQVLGTDASKIHTQWQRANNAEFSETTVKDHGLLKISNVLETDAGDYHCLGLGEDGTEHLRKTASLNVLSPPKIVFKINEANFKVGDTLSATCTATGGEITLELETDDKILLPNEKIEGPVLTVSNIPKNFERKYWCKASNEVGTSRTYIAPRIKKVERK